MILDSILYFFSSYTYLVSFLGAFFGGEETILVLFTLANQGIMNPIVVFIFTYLGTFSADIMWFYLGKVRYLSRLKELPFVHNVYLRAERIMHKVSNRNTFRLLFITKFISGTRIATIMYVGRKNLSLKNFIKYNSIVILIWSILLFSIGNLFGEGISLIMRTYKDIKLLIIYLIVFAIAFYIAKWFINKWVSRKRKISI